MNAPDRYLDTKDEPVTFVTIAFSGDLALIRLQARSMARFLGPEEVGEILLVMNEADETALRRALTSLAADYGPHRDKLRILTGDEVLMGRERTRQPTLFERVYVENRFRLPFLRRGGWRGGNGYRMQQALKLASARAARFRRMVILDGKNIFLRAPRPNEWFAADGRARLAYETVGPAFHRNWLRESLDMLDVRVPPEKVQETSGYTTPYPVSRRLVLDVLDALESRHGSVQSVFAGKRRPSEFMLIFAFCLKHFGGPHAVFENVEKEQVGLWDSFDAQARDKALTAAETDTPLTFGLHRNAVSQLDAVGRRRIVTLFAERGIDISTVVPDASPAQDD